MIHLVYTIIFVHAQIKTASKQILDGNLEHVAHA